jgi:hypothetical protein
MNGEARVLVAPALPSASNLPVIARKISPFHRLWPAGGLVMAATVNVIWMGFLGYWFFKLFAPALF